MSFHGCARGRQPKHRGKWKGHPRKNKINYLHRSLNRIVASKRVQDNRTHYFFGHGHSSGLSPEWREREREWRKKGHREGERQRCGCAICKEPLKPKDKQTDWTDQTKPSQIRNGWDVRNGIKMPSVGVERSSSKIMHGAAVHCLSKFVLLCQSLTVMWLAENSTIYGNMQRNRSPPATQPNNVWTSFWIEIGKYTVL